MYYKLDDNELEAMFKISKITMTDYELIGNFAPVEKLINVIEDLLTELDRAKEKIEQIEKDRDENYKPISYAEQVGYNIRDFV